MKIARLPISLFALCAVTLLAQQSHHTTTTAHHRAAAACPPTEPAMPALPAGIPPATGKVETAFALRYMDIKPGDGPEAQPGQFYTVHYTGWLASDGSKFDSSVDRNEPFTFLQGRRSVIPGWDSGFGGMHVGGKRRFFIPYQLAYGERGRPPVIPPKSDLIFDIELRAASDTPPEEPAPPDRAAAATTTRATGATSAASATDNAATAVKESYENESSSCHPGRSEPIGCFLPITASCRLLRHRRTSHHAASPQQQAAPRAPMTNRVSSGCVRRSKSKPARDVHTVQIAWPGPGIMMLSYWVVGSAPSTRPIAWQACASIRRDRSEDLEELLIARICKCALRKIRSDHA